MDSDLKYLYIVYYFSFASALLWPIFYLIVSVTLRPKCISRLGNIWTIVIKAHNIDSVHHLNFYSKNFSKTLKFFVFFFFNH